MPLDANRPITPPSGSILRGRHILVAVVAHALLFLALSLNMQWRSETPPPSMAELWTELPTPVPQNNRRPPEHTPPSNLQPQPQPVVNTPDTALADTDIGLVELRHRQEAEEAEKRRLAEEALRRQQVEQERQAREQREREEAQRRRVEEERKAHEATERQRQEQERLAAEEKTQQEERKARETAQRQEQERLAAEEKTRQEEAERQRRAEEERKRQEEEKRQRLAREAAERDRIMQDQLNRIQGMAGGEGNSNTGTTGSPGGSGNAHAAYTSRLASIVRRNIVYTGDRNASPTVQVYVETDNNGRITTVRLTRSSGNPSWDEAAIRGIWKTETFPPDTNGKRPSTKFNFTLRPE
ncbi:MAG: cell envelope integrity protein TolA [Saezia sp.]